MVTSRAFSRALGLGVAAIVAIVLMALFVIPQAAHAGVGPGGSSSGGGGACPKPPTGNINGCPYTTNGQGWYEIAVDSPNAPVGNGYWSTANSTCKREGATHVMAYVVLTGEQRLRDGWIYKYIWGWERGNPYTGNVPIPTAQARFNALPASERAGYTFGSNLGWFCYNIRTPWSIRAESYIRKSPSTTFVQTNLANVRPGQTIQFAHDLRAQNRINERIYYTIRGSGFPDSFRRMGQPWSSPTTIMHGSVAPNIAHNTLFVNFNANGGAANASYMTYAVQQSDVGKNLCQRIEYQPTTDINGNASATAYRCASVPYSYTLTPQITGITDNEIVESASGALPVVGRVTNSGFTKSHANIQWQVTQAIYDPGDPIPNRSGGIDARTPCNYFSGTRTCGIATNGSGTETGGYAYNASVPYNATGNVGDYEVGTRICYAMSIKRNSSSNTDWRHSRMFCRVVGKEPKVQVLGGDLIVGRGTAYNSARISNVTTSRSQQLSGLYYGSWAEYGIVASGNVTDMASGSGYANGSPTNVMCSISLLTLTNGGDPTCNSSTIGGYTYTTQSPNIAGRFPISSSTKVITGASVTLGSATNPMREVYTTSRPTLSISGGSDIVAGQWAVINAPNTDVTISSNINYTTGSLTSVRDIPQVVIIARNIYISDAVSNIDAWLVATGSDAGGVQHGVINTCAAGGVAPNTLPNSRQCSTKLTINGPVSANHLYLHRTAGAGTGTEAGDPAEVLNLRADAYIWASNYAPGTGRLPSVVTKELPPRF